MSLFSEMIIFSPQFLSFSSSLAVGLWHSTWSGEHYLLNTPHGKVQPMATLYPVTVGSNGAPSSQAWSMRPLRTSTTVTWQLSVRGLSHQQSGRPPVLEYCMATLSFCSELTAVYFANTLRKHLTFCLSLIKFMSLMKLMGEFLALVNSVAQGTRQAFKKHKPREVVNEWVVRSLEKTLLLLWMHFSKMGRWDPTCELHINTQPPCRCLFTYETVTHFLTCKSEARRGWFLIISWPVRWQSLSNWMIVYCSVTIATSNWAHVKLQASCLEKSIFL